MIGALLAAWFGIGAVTGPASLIDTGVPQPTSDATNAFDAASAAFERRVVGLHPVGSDAGELRQALAADGFRVLGETRGTWEAEREDDGFMCLLHWQVTWTEAGGLLTEVGGYHWGECL